MYTMALVILIGIVAQTVVSVANEHVPFLKRIPVLGKGEGWLIAASILLVWGMDISILGTFMGESGATLEPGLTRCSRALQLLASPMSPTPSCSSWAACGTDRTLHAFLPGAVFRGFRPTGHRPSKCPALCDVHWARV